jgi:hypothetical protein
MRKRPVGLLITAVLFVSLLFFLHFPVDAVPYDWSKPRPTSYRRFNETIANAYTDERASVGIGLTTGDYDENDPGRNNHDHQSLNVVVSANSREGIEYLVSGVCSYNWYSVSNPTGITGDDSGYNLTIPLYPGPILFYGVEYWSVWVCSNGFISFDNNRIDANPSSIPNTQEPNAIIAPFWRDLKPNLGGSITWGIVQGFYGNWALVISWNNVPDASGTPQTFQVVIEMPGNSPSGNVHHLIYF